MSSSTESTPKTGVTAAVTPTAGSEPAGQPPPKRRRELFRMLLSILKDPERAYTVSEDIMSAAGENVVAQIGARVDALSAQMGARVDTLAAQMGARLDALSARMDGFDARMDALDAKLDALAESMNTRIDALAETVKAQWRVLWGVFGLQAALLVVIITLLLRGSSR